MGVGLDKDVVPVQHPGLGGGVDVFAGGGYVMHAAVLRYDGDPWPVTSPRVRLHLHRFARQKSVQVVVGVILLFPPAGILVVGLLAVGGQYLVVHEHLIAHQALVPPLSCVVDLMFSSVLGQSKDLVTVATRVFLFPRVGVEVAAEARQADVGPLADDAHIESLPVHDELVVILQLCFGLFLVWAAFL